MNARQTILSDFIHKHPYAVSQFLEGASNEDVAVFFQVISLQNRIKLFSVMEAKTSANILKFLPKKLVKEWIENTDTIIAASVLSYLDPTSKNEIIDSLNEKRKYTISQQISFLPNTIAEKIEKGIVITKQMEKKEVIELVKQAKQPQVIFIYVVDVEGVFQGVIKLKDIILADETVNIENLPIEKIQSFLPDTPIKGMISHPIWAQFPEVPIVNASGYFLGSLSYRKIFQISNGKESNPNSEIAETGNALGELFSIGLSGLLQGSRK